MGNHGLTSKCVQSPCCVNCLQGETGKAEDNASILATANAVLTTTSPDEITNESIEQEIATKVAFWRMDTSSAGAHSVSYGLNSLHALDPRTYGGRSVELPYDEQRLPSSTSNCADSPETTGLHQESTACSSSDTTALARPGTFMSDRETPAVGGRAELRSSDITPHSSSSEHNFEGFIEAKLRDAWDDGTRLFARSTSEPVGDCVSTLRPEPGTESFASAELVSNTTECVGDSELRTHLERARAYVEEQDLDTTERRGAVANEPWALRPGAPCK